MSEYSDLVESVRKDEAFISSVAQGRLYPLTAAMRRRDWTVPSYDAVELIDNLPSEDFNSLSKRSLEYLRSNEFQAPHENFVLRTGTKDFEAYIYVTSVRSKLGHSCSDEVWKNLSSWPESKILGDVWIPSKDEFICNDNLITGNHILTDAETNDKLPLRVKNALGRCSIDMRIFCLLMHYRGNPEVLRLSEMPTSAKLASINRGRALAKDINKRGPIPPTRSIVYVSTKPMLDVVIAPSPRSPGGGSPKTGHTRVGHWHRYGKAKVPKWISEIAVKGGPQTVPPTKQLRLREDAGGNS